MTLVKDYNGWLAPEERTTLKYLRTQYTCEYTPCKCYVYRAKDKLFLLETKAHLSLPIDRDIRYYHFENHTQSLKHRHTPTYTGLTEGWWDLQVPATAYTLLLALTEENTPLARTTRVFLTHLGDFLEELQGIQYVSFTRTREYFEDIVDLTFTAPGKGIFKLDNCAPDITRLCMRIVHALGIFYSSDWPTDERFFTSWLFKILRRRMNIPEGQIEAELIKLCGYAILDHIVQLRIPPQVLTECQRACADVVATLSNTR